MQGVLLVVRVAEVELQVVVARQRVLERCDYWRLDTGRFLGD
jgi:hypothetical protein